MLLLVISANLYHLMQTGDNLKTDKELSERKCLPGTAQATRHGLHADPHYTRRSYSGVLASRCSRVSETLVLELPVFS